MITWRPYQTEIIDKVFTDWQIHDSLLVVAATGAGKTNVLWGVADRFIDEHPGARICVLAHRKELIEQPKARLEQFWPQRGGQAGIVMGTENESHRRIVIATVQTLGHKNGRRLRDLLRYGKIDLLITDEAHHVSAKSYQNVVDALRTVNPALKHLGVTATPERGDKKSLNATYQCESANVGVIRLIDEGWLCRPEVHGVKTNVDLSGVSVHGSGGNRDYNQEQLVAAVETDDCFKLVVKTHMEKIGDRPTIAFVPSVAGAYRLAALLREKGIKAIAADGTTPKAERAAVIEGFRRGEYTTICNVALWTEGLDLPNLECCHLVRPTKSDALYLQMVGRVLRINEGKDKAEIFDYQPVNDRNLDMRMKLLGIKKPKPAILLAGAGNGGGVSNKVLHKAGDRIEYVILNYFNKRKEAWITAESGWQIVGLGKGEDGIDRSLAVAPDGRELWAVWRKEGERWYQAKPFASGEFDDIAKKTDEMIRKHSSKNLVNKRAPWRSGPPSDKQIDLARREGIYRPGMTKGELSDELNKKWVMQAVTRQARRIEQGALSS